MTAPDKAWDSFTNKLDDLSSQVSGAGSRSIRSARVRALAKDAAETFFRDARPRLEAIGLASSAMTGFDTDARQLLELSQGQSPRDAYSRTIGRLLKRVRRAAVDLAIHAGSQAGKGAPGATPIEMRILQTLEAILPHTASSYEQAVSDLGGPNRSSYRGTAHELREVIRETLDHFAPDADVMAEPHFKLEEGRDRPTQTQKMRFILSKRRLARSATALPVEAVARIEEHGESLPRAVYARGSASAHSPTSEGEVRQLKMYADAVLCEILEIHSGARGQPPALAE